MLLTITLAMEYEAVCQRAEHREGSGLSVQEVDKFLDAFIAMAEPVAMQFLWRPQLRDPNDEMVLAAVNGCADSIVTFNLRDYGTAASQFGAEVLLPRDDSEH